MIGGSSHSPPGQRESTGRPRPEAWICRALLVAVLAYGAFLRLDGLFIRYGPLTQPGWMAALEAHVRGAHDTLVPRDWRFEKIDRPYVGGDPAGYLQFSREMRHFYQPHVREPVFLAAVRLFLWLLGNQDVAISFASVAFSMLAVLGTYLLGAAIGGRWAGLVAAAALAVDWDMVAWASEGWRDDAFTALVCLNAWALLRFWQRRTWTSALVAGILAGLACLTRITSLSFLLPALVALALSGRRPSWTRSLARVALAAGVMTALVAPYLINCYREFGDPFVAVNVHTAFYRAGAGEAPDPAQHALAYIAERFTRRPIASADTAFRGLFVFPFENKWGGLRWLFSIHELLRLLAIAGLFAWLWSPVGRMMILLLLSSLIPYMLTWSLPGGDEWRFTMHAYPFYLVAAGHAGALAVRYMRAVSLTKLRAAAPDRAARRTLAVRGLVLAGLAGILLLEAFWSPVLVAEEMLRAGENVTIGAGEDDAFFFTHGWSDLVTTGAVTARLAVAPRATLRVPLPERRRYVLAVRMDPLPDRPDQRVRIFVEERLVGTFPLTWTPGRVGSYEIEITPDLAGKTVHLTFMAETIAPPGAASPYAGPVEAQPVAFRLWYVRVRPS